MAETVRSLVLKARALLDEYSEDGSIIPDADVVDLQTKSIPLVDMAQKELYKIGKLYKTFEFSNKPAPNLLGLLSNFEIVDYLGTPQYYPQNGITGAKAYYFEVDGEATIRIEELNGTWQTLTTINVPNTVTSMTAYKGHITSLNPVRIVFDGTTHYRHSNRCLFSYPFASGKIPDYRPWYKVTMPSDFRTIDQIVNEFPQRQYARDTQYKWEGFKDLYVNYYYEGNIRVVYKPVPTAITTLDDVLEIDDITAQAIVYYVAAKLAPFENKELVNFFETKFMELKVENTKDSPVSEEMIVDVYSVRGGN